MHRPVLRPQQVFIPFSVSEHDWRSASTRCTWSEPSETHRTAKPVRAPPIGAAEGGLHANPSRRVSNMMTCECSRTSDFHSEQRIAPRCTRQCVLPPIRPVPSRWSDRFVSFAVMPAYGWLRCPSSNYCEILRQLSTSVSAGKSNCRPTVPSGIRPSGLLSREAMFIARFHSSFLPVCGFEA
jgi:hypothetical protein